MDSYFSSSRFKNQTKEQGFVLITALMVIFLVVTIVSTVALVTASDIRSAAKARAAIETRLTAESVSDAVFASIAAEKFNLYNKAVSSFSTIPTISALDNNRNPLVSIGSDGYGRWFALKSDGKLSLCNNVELVRGVCFKARLHQDTVLATKSQQITLDIVARGGCIVQNVSAPTSCIFRQFQQVFRTRSFIENVTLTQSESPNASVTGVPINPNTGNPYKVAYINSDKLIGKIRTNDNNFLRCGNVGGPGSDVYFSSDLVDSEQLLSASTDCNGSDFVNRTGDPNDKFLPSQIDTQGSNDLTQSNNVFKALAGGAPGSSNYSLNGPVTLELQFGKIFINETLRPYPSNGVIYVNGNLTLKDSKYSRSLSIVATGDISIQGNLQIASGLSETINGVASTPSETDPMLGISSRGNIRLTCTTGPGQCEDRYVVGVLSAKTGTIFNTQWNSAPIANKDIPPRFFLYGSLIANNRPIFGAYTSVSGAKAVFGWAKTLKFDNRLLATQPPYFFRTSQASVVRSSINITKCSESFCN